MGNYTTVFTRIDAFDYMAKFFVFPYKVDVRFLAQWTYFSWHYYPQLNFSSYFKNNFKYLSFTIKTLKSLYLAL